LSQLQHLSVCHVVMRDGYEWTNETTSIFRQGFRRLSCLKFAVHGKLTPSKTLEDDPSKDGRRVQLHRLRLSSNGGEFSIGPQIARNFYSILDPTSLLRIELRGSRAWQASICHLSRHSNLAVLTIGFSRRSMNRHFSGILAAIPQLPSLKHLDLHIVPTNGPGSLLCPIALSTVLASFSPSLRQLSAMQIVFSDFATLPIRDSPRKGPTKIVILQGLLPVDGGEPGVLLLWGEKQAGGIEWYREGREKCYRKFVSRTRG
jgi:hypothetical protein